MSWEGSQDPLTRLRQEYDLDYFDKTRHNSCEDHPHVQEMGWRESGEI